jgi:hypothetical protein
LLSKALGNKAFPLRTSESLVVEKKVRLTYNLGITLVLKILMSLHGYVVRTSKCTFLLVPLKTKLRICAITRDLKEDVSIASP